jgi:hypothetical protein
VGVLPATPEAKVGGLRFKASLGKISVRSYPKNKQTNKKKPQTKKQKDWRCGSSSRALAYQVQGPMLPKKKNECATILF